MKEKWNAFLAWLKGYPKKFKTSSKWYKIGVITLAVCIVFGSVGTVTSNLMMKKQLPGEDGGASSIHNPKVELLRGSEKLGLQQGGQQFAFYDDGTYRAKGYLIQDNKAYEYETDGTYNVTDGRLTFAPKPIKMKGAGEWESALTSIVLDNKWTIVLTGKDGDDKVYTLAQYDLGKEEADKLGVTGIGEYKMPDTSFFKVDNADDNLTDLLSGMDTGSLMSLMGVPSFATSGEGAEFVTYNTDGALVSINQQGFVLSFYDDGTYTLNGSAAYEGQTVALSQKDTYSVKNNQLILDNATQAVVKADMLKEYGMDNFALSTAHNAINKNGEVTVNIVLTIPSYGSETVGSYVLSKEDAAKLGITGEATGTPVQPEKEPEEVDPGFNVEPGNVFTQFWTMLQRLFGQFFHK